MQKNAKVFAGMQKYAMYIIVIKSAQNIENIKSKSVQVHNSFEINKQKNTVRM